MVLGQPSVCIKYEKADRSQSWNETDSESIVGSVSVPGNRLW